MIRTLSGIFIILHGLVHFWYVVLSFGWVPFQPDMGWTGQSWLLSPIIHGSITRPISSILFIITALAFSLSGVGIIIEAEWLQTLLLTSAIISSFALILFWDGNFDMIVQKGIIGLLINIAVIIIVSLNQ